MTYGICSGLSAVVGGRLTKCIPQFIIVYTFSLIMLSMVLFLIFWEKEPSYVIAFVPTAIFGLCEGIWHSVPPSKSSNICAVFSKYHKIVTTL